MGMQRLCKKTWKKVIVRGLSVFVWGAQQESSQETCFVLGCPDMMGEEASRPCEIYFCCLSFPLYTHKQRLSPILGRPWNPLQETSSEELVCSFPRKRQVHEFKI